MIRPDTSTIVGAAVRKERHDRDQTNSRATRRVTPIVQSLRCQVRFPNLARKPSTESRARIAVRFPADDIDLREQEKLLLFGWELFVQSQV
jgi:hypothetical protein